MSLNLDALSPTTSNGVQGCPPMSNRVKPPPDPGAERARIFAEMRTGEMELKEAIRGLRRLTGLSQVEFAKAHGIAERTYVDFERGAGNPTLDTLQKIAAALGVRLIVSPGDVE